LKQKIQAIKEAKAKSVEVESKKEDKAGKPVFSSKLLGRTTEHIA